MRIAVLGATGNSGLQLIAQGLQRNHQVTAIVRNTEKLAPFTNDKNFKAIKANILNPDELAGHIAGHDCVMSALGTPGVKLFKITFYLESIQAIVKAMRKANVKRLVCITAFYTKPDSNYPTVYKVVLRPMIGRQLDSMYEMEQWLFSEANDIDYTIVRPGRLLDDPLKDQKEIIAPDAYYFPDGNTMNQIPRANVAKIMLDVMERHEHVKKAIAVDLPK